MKIVLSTLPREGEFVNWQTNKKLIPQDLRYMPLGILSLASNLPPEHEVVLLDAASRNWSIDETVERIETEKPDVLGLSSLTRRVWAMNEILRKTTTPYKVVGGPHATNYAHQILEAGADAVFVGQLADKEFAGALETRPTGVVPCNSQINDINFPRRDLLDLDFYFFKGEGMFKAERRLPMFSSIGCPNRCTFCNVQSKKMQYKNPQIILDEMQYLYSLGIRSIHVLDDNFNLRASHINGILDEMEGRGFSCEWSGRGQVKTDLTLVPRLAKKNFRRIHVGIEALDDKILASWYKNQTVSDVERFCETMVRNNIDIFSFFITGSPLETEQYRMSLPQRIRDLGIKYPFFMMLFPEPNTEYYASLLRDGFYSRDYWAEFMRSPVPDFEIPYPYGESRKQELMDYNEWLINSFKKV